ncbi:Techylectin-5B [Araneus ventricosus]|uniref:Techylectin-5B n=1 Tax=Araneus ventricosus TaxID=182803 RepID=A0A4Y2FTS6_ARAVE|nr:Techylectin-5B [Araneus ventricosus]
MKRISPGHRAPADFTRKERSVTSCCDVTEKSRGLELPKVVLVGGRDQVIQRRGKFPVQQDFYLDWESYKNGFGNISQEFWLGNENIQVLCRNECKMRFDFQDKNGEKSFALYQSFISTTSDYRLTISDYSGNAGDAMKFHDGYVFSTKDKGFTKGAMQWQGGWWYGDNLYCNLNGVYQPGEKNALTVFWWEWRRNENLAGVEMKVMPK